MVDLFNHNAASGVTQIVKQFAQNQNIK